MAHEDLHRHIIDSLKTAIVVVEPDLSVSFINQAAEALLDISGSRVIGEPLDQLFREADSSSANLLKSLQHAHAFTKRETQLNLTNGQQITVDCAVTPIFEEQNIRPSMLLELQPLNRLLRISREEGLLSSQQTSQALVRGLAHEIKNPLGGLRGAAQLLAKELPDPSLGEYTNIIIEEADRLSRLVDQMLGPREVPRFAPLNIHEVLERVRNLIDAETGGSIEIVRDYDPSIPDLSADREQMIQATLNIMRNAMQAVQTRYYGDRPRIQLQTRILRQFTVGAQRHRLVCQVDISDNGPGIPASLMETIFLPMVSGRADGTGLGLSISQSIINRHKGLIECHSRPGQTTFSIYIPLEHS